MEKIKMYAVKWRGKASECEYEVMNTLDKIGQVCVDVHDDDIFASYSIDVDKAFQTEEIEMKIITMNKETAKSMVEWFKDKVGMEMKMEEIEVSPLPFED